MELVEVEAFDDLAQEEDRIPRWNQVAQSRWDEESLVGCVLTILAHD